MLWQNIYQDTLNAICIYGKSYIHTFTFAEEMDRYVIREIRLAQQITAR